MPLTARGATAATLPADLGCEQIAEYGRGLVRHRTDFLAYSAHFHLGREIVVLARPEAARGIAQLPQSRSARIGS